MSNVIDIKTRRPITQRTSPETDDHVASLSDEELEALIEALSVEI